MSKHTPGPWVVKKLRARYARFCAINTVDGSPVGESYEEKNARLIAAAPELLETLENLLKVHEGEGGTQHHAGDMARAAIAKAKGE
jgi:hypothetical protein